MIHQVAGCGAAMFAAGRVAASECTAASFVTSTEL
jgi:hypothetical protein